MRRAILLVAVTAIAGVLVLNIAGVLRYPGGPLREPNADGALWLDTRPADQGNSPIGNTAEADWATTGTDLVFSSLWLSDAWPLPASVEAITPIDVSGGLVTTAALVRRADAGPDSRVWGFGQVSPDQRTMLDTDYGPLPASIGAGESQRNVALVVRGPKPGAAGFEAVAIDYRVGPFSFRVVHHMGLHACLGSTGLERTCPDVDE